MPFMSLINNIYITYLSNLNPNVIHKNVLFVLASFMQYDAFSVSKILTVSRQAAWRTTGTSYMLSPQCISYCTV